jgi:twinkle protein
VDESAPDAMLVCEKQRNGEWEGRVALWFHDGSQQFVGAHGARPQGYVPE